VARPELAMLFDETVALYLRLNSFAALIYRRGDISGPRRTILMALDRSGPQTVAHLARARSQSRQRIQPLVNALVSEGLLEQRDNPVHKRSPILVLTSRGDALVRHIGKTEGALRAGLRVNVSKRKIAASAEVLRQVRLALENPAATHAVHKLRRGRR
jgi:DNA-binding MarR family transcriptional regulator